MRLVLFVVVKPINTMQYYSVNHLNCKKMMTHLSLNSILYNKKVVRLIDSNNWDSNNYIKIILNHN